jgi:hypothetical protein
MTYAISGVLMTVGLVLGVAGWTAAQQPGQVHGRDRMMSNNMMGRERMGGRWMVERQPSAAKGEDGYNLYG